MSANGLARMKVLVAGGGIAALELALALRELAGDRVAVELRSPRADLVYRPAAVGEPFGAADVLRFELDDLAERCGCEFRLGGVRAVDAAAHVAVAADGERIPYDRLVIATGARSLWAVPGSTVFWGVADENGTADAIHRLRAGRLRDVVFAVPSGPTWLLPPYELALLARAVLTRSGIADARIAVVTPEDAPLGVFGRPVAERMREVLAARRVELHAGRYPVAFEDGELRVVPGEPLRTQAVISLPRLEGRAISGLPADADGFLPVGEGCAVEGVEDVYAAGEATDFPLKHGGIACQQAEAVAAAIAHEAGLGPEPEPFDPELRGVLWTGGEPLYLRGRLSGKHGEDAELSDVPPWPDRASKVLCRHLSPLLAGATGHPGRAS